MRLARAGNEHWAVLESAVPLAIPLILGGIGVLSEDNAVFATLLVAVGALGIWGGIASRQRGSGWPQVVVAAVASALIGVVIILLKSWL
jgi:ABC-type proline/glycine betaine transport system permease subunit